ncbi:unnamed protein product [Staurois parvus]|uniref:Alpha/beta hydrolase domain-containing protein 17C n=1 Tax=Staurois parvus TaxID=386267 RepID=A0ABN9ERJ6_9NEOB|nr:unnamed protein product [Staurois parvus]
MPEQGPRMNGFSLGELCWLFCCPPCPSRIAAKLAFLPPEPTYTVREAEGSGGGQAASAEGEVGAEPAACSLHLTERADWQYSQRELDAVEVFRWRTERGSCLGCMFVRCAPGSRYTLLFSHGNAVDLGQMCSFYIGLGSRINCNVFSYDYSGYGVSSGRPARRTSTPTSRPPGTPSAPGVYDMDRIRGYTGGGGWGPDPVCMTWGPDTGIYRGGGNRDRTQCV